MPQCHRTFSPFYKLYLPSFQFITRPGNRRKRTFWCHGSHRVSISPPEHIFSFLSTLTTAGPPGGISCRLLGLFYPFYMCISQGEALGMQVSDSLPPSPYRCTDREYLVLSSPNINTHLYIDHYTPLHAFLWMQRVYKPSGWYPASHPSLLLTFPLLYLCRSITSHVYSHIYEHVAIYI